MHDALLRIIRDRPVSQITVSELCRAASIHRTTFYKHYSTVTEFVQSLFSEADDLLGERGQAAADSPDPCRVAGTRVLEAVISRRAIYRGLLGPEGDPAFQRLMLDRLAERFAGAVSATAPRGGLPVPPDVAGAALAGAIMGVAEHAVRSDTADVEGALQMWLACVPDWCARDGTGPGAEPA